MAMKLQTLLLALLLFIAYCADKATAAPTASPAPAPPPPDDDDDDDGDAPEPGVTPKDEVWTWCVEDADDLPTCQSMTTALRALDPEKDEHTHNCIVGDGDEDCMKKVQRGDAKFVILDGGEIWEANNEYGLIPIRTEVSALEGQYYGVGIVKKGQCPGSLNDLKGKRSCHTGYGRSSGWVLPVTYFIDNKIMPRITKGPQSNDIESVKGFFSASCAADSEAEKSICTACSQKNACTLADKYYDYEGAFRGVVEGACDVAFTKHTIVAQYSVGGTTAQDWTGLQDATNYQILCPSKYNGQTCTDAANYKSCNFGEAPGHAIMVAPTFPAYEVMEFQNLLDAANSDPTFNDLFFSGKNVKGNLFAADATKTLAYNGTTQSLLGKLYTKIKDLETINTPQAASQNINSGIKTVSSLIVSIFAGVLYFLCSN